MWQGKPSRRRAPGSGNSLGGDDAVFPQTFVGPVGPVGHHGRLRPGEQRKLSKVAHSIYRMFNSDGKYILDNNKLIICQSNAPTEEIKKHYTRAIINPLGDWTGGFNVDAGATNRKLGSDMADSVTGGGLHGKDCSKADVSINIYLWQIAQEHKSTFTASCAIGDDTVTIYKGEEIFETLPYAYIVLEAKTYIESKGGFEKFAEWGLV